MKNLKKFLGVFVLVFALALFIPNSVKAEEKLSIESYLNDEGYYEVMGTPAKSENELIFQILIKAFENWDMYYNKVDIDNFTIGKDATTFDLILDPEGKAEKHTVTVKYVYDKEVEKKINELLSELIDKISNSESYDLEEVNISDLDMIHHYYYQDKYDYIEEKGENNELQRLYFMDSFASYFKNLVNNRNVNFRMMLLPWSDVEGLNGDRFLAFGWYDYDNSTYFFRQQMIDLNLNHIFYVPSNTPNTAEDIKVAAQKRINDYLNNEKVTIDYISEEIRTAEDYLIQNHINTENENVTEYFETNYGISDVTKDDYIYKVTMKYDEESESTDKTFYIIIKRDSDKRGC